MAIARWISAAGIALAMIAGGGVAAAAPNVCMDLQARLAALDRGGGQSAEAYRQYDSSVNKQRIEIERATAEARRAGCSGGLFSLRRPDPKCGKLTATISQMQANLARLIAARDGYGRDPFTASRQRGELLRALAFNRCGGYATFERGPGNRGLLSTLFGQSRLRTWGEEGFFGGSRYGTYRTLCVRTCDGYYFPISFSTIPDRFGVDQQTCQAMCPGADVALYTHRNPGEDSNSMVSLAGEPYTALPTAFRYRDQYDANCTCRSATAATYAGSAADTRLPGQAFALAAPVTIVPIPSPRPVPGEDPETLANRAGDLFPVPIASSRDADVARVSADGQRKIRVVGPEYYYAE